MTMRAVKAYVKVHLDGIEAPTLPTGGLLGRVVPEPFDLMAQPTYWIWPDSINETRLGGNRAASLAQISMATGKKWRDYTLRISIMADLSTQTTDESGFDDLVDLVLAHLRSMPVNVLITDAATGEQSTFYNIGESFRVRMPKPYPRSDQGIWRYEAIINNEFKEISGG